MSFEAPAGPQDPGPPDIRLALRVAADLLHDIADSGELDETSDLVVRVRAVRRVLVRVLGGFEGG